jgi:putative FmdB family regulatory protein
MPIYEYACMECESHFEELVRGSEEPPCPQCGASNVLRQLSVFSAVGSAAQTSGGGSSGGCCGGGCGCSR